jgi:hypothetical protein
MSQLCLQFSGLRVPHPHYFWEAGSGSVLTRALKAQNRAVDAHNSGVEAQNGALAGGSEDHWSQIRSTLLSSRLKIRVRI